MKPDPLSRMHSAEHLLNGTMVQKFHCQRSFSAHINKKKSKCDYVFDRNLKQEEIQDLEDRINQVISDDLPVKQEFIARSEAESLFNLERLPDAVGEEIRIIRMGDYDAVPCIGQHVEHTSQIGEFKITTSSFEDGVLRLRFKLAEVD